MTSSSASPIGRILYFPFEMMNNKRVINSVSNAPIGRLIGLASVAMTDTDNGNFKNGVLKLNGGCGRTRPGRSRHPVVFILQELHHLRMIFSLPNRPWQNWAISSRSHMPAGFLVQKILTIRQ